MALAGMPSIAGFIPPSALINSGISLGGAALLNGILGKTWGIVNEFGVPIVLADTVASLDYNAGTSISKYPVENGKFASYNKVNNPSHAQVVMVIGGNSVTKRSLFLTQLELLLKSTLSFYVISPEYVYMNYQIVGISYSRSASDGATMISVTIDLEEVMDVKVNYATEEVKNPSDSKTVDGGAKTTNPTTNTSILKGLFS